MNLLNWLFGNKAKPALATVRVGLLPIDLTGSLQNPAWSPDGSKIAFTRFRKGYNEGPADVFILDLSTNVCHSIVSDGSDNVSQPGATWNKRTGDIVFSSDRGGTDQIYAIKEVGAKPRQVTSAPRSTAYEPSLSPDGKLVVVESHRAETRTGQIIIFDMDGQIREVVTLLGDDCRQPNWSPGGDFIVYQKQHVGRWELFLYNVVTKVQRNVTAALPGDKTDATFSPDGTRILFSGIRPGSDDDGLLILSIAGGKPTVVNHDHGYYGAASWSPDGAYVACETSAGDPDGGAGTKLEILKV